MMGCNFVRRLIQAYLGGALSARDGERLRQHCQRCTACGEALREAQADARLVASMARVPYPESDAAALLARVRAQGQERLAERLIGSVDTAPAAPRGAWERAGERWDALRHGLALAGFRVFAGGIALPACAGVPVAATLLFLLYHGLPTAPKLPVVQESRPAGAGRAAAPMSSKQIGPHLAAKLPASEPPAATAPVDADTRPDGQAPVDLFSSAAPKNGLADTRGPAGSPPAGSVGSSDDEIRREMRKFHDRRMAEKGIAPAEGTPARVSPPAAPGRDALFADGHSTGAATPPPAPVPPNASTYAMPRGAAEAVTGGAERQTAPEVLRTVPRVGGAAAPAAGGNGGAAPMGGGGGGFGGYGSAPGSVNSAAPRQSAPPGSLRFGSRRPPADGIAMKAARSAGLPAEGAAKDDRQDVAKGTLAEEPTTALPAPTQAAASIRMEAHGGGAPVTAAAKPASAAAVAGTAAGGDHGEIAGAGGRGGRGGRVRTTAAVDPSAALIAGLEKGASEAEDAAKALGRRKDAAAVPALAKVLRTRREDAVLKAAAQALAAIGTPEALDALRAAAKEDTPAGKAAQAALDAR